MGAANVAVGNHVGNQAAVDEPVAVGLLRRQLGEDDLAAGTKQDRVARFELARRVRVEDGLRAPQRQDLVAVRDLEAVGLHDAAFVGARLSHVGQLAAGATTTTPLLSR